MKKFLIDYILYIYVNFILNNEIDIYKEWAKPYIRFLSLIKNIYVWFASILFFPIFVICMNINKELTKFKNRRKLITFKNIYL
jgi:hypothetical protein